MNESDLVALFKCLGDKSRLQIVRSLAAEEMYVERLSERLGLSPATVSFHLKKLEGIGAVTSRKEQYYTLYSLCPAAFPPAVLALLTGLSAPDDAQEAREAAYRAGVLSSFFAYGRLKKLPAQRKKKHIILEEIATRFTPGRDYSEREVNLIISEVHDDFCTIRRDMIGCGLLSRADGIYRKLSDRAR